MFCIKVFDYLIQACLRDPSPLSQKPELAYLANLLNQVSEERLEIRWEQVARFMTRRVAVERG